MGLNENNSVLLIVDIQEKLLNAVFNKEVLEKKSEILVKAMNILNIPIYITEQYPKGLGETIKDFKLNAKVYEKSAFNALEVRELKESLNDINKKEIIVIGIETHICVYQTVLALLAEEYNVTVLKDACGSRSYEEYDQALVVMEKAGASIKTVEMLLFELLKTSKHPNFKEVQSLIK